MNLTSNSKLNGRTRLDTLHFPEDFPPSDPWKKFFVGVRWLGPDLSFFKTLKKTQAARPASAMETWRGGLRQKMAEAISRALSEQLGWKSCVFLPGDSAAVAFHGPRFDFNDPESALEAVTEVLKRDFKITVPEVFWAGYGDSTFGELVDGLVRVAGNSETAAA